MVTLIVLVSAILAMLTVDMLVVVVPTIIAVTRAMSMILHMCMTCVVIKILVRGLVEIARGVAAPPLAQPVDQLLQLVDQLPVRAYTHLAVAFAAHENLPMDGRQQAEASNQGREQRCTLETAHQDVAICQH